MTPIDAIVLHGGPAATTSADGLAELLRQRLRVLSPAQRGSGEVPLTVAVHIEDLRALVAGLAQPSPPALVGHSWGAMLALAFAAAHPELAGPLVLVGCGTFDLDSRARMRELIAERRAAGLEPYAVDWIPGLTDPDPPFDERAHHETWNDMLAQQAAGVYPAAFAAIRQPAIMLHGDWDPHPGPMIHAVLQQYLPQLEYREFARCGHDPWAERAAREAFGEVLFGWLAITRDATAL